MPDTAFDYLETGNVAGGDDKRVTTGAGNNPSTWAGVIVIGAVLTLGVLRKSFRRFM